MATFVVCDSFKAEVLCGTHLPNSHVFRLALFVRNPASPGLIGALTTAYAATINGAAEIADGNGYTTTGYPLVKDTDVTTDIFLDGTNVTVRKNTTSHYAGYDWADAVWGGFTYTGFKANGFYGLIYNSTLAGKNAVAVGEWVANDLANDPSAANFTVTMPGTGNVTVKFA